jgi:hypothetical protein
MNNTISPQLVQIVHQEKIQKLEREIEMARIAKEQRSWIKAGPEEQSWYAQAVQWVRVKLFNRAPAYEQAAVQRETIQEPCTGVPC